MVVDLIDGAVDGVLHLKTELFAMLSTAVALPASISV